MKTMHSQQLTRRINFFTRKSGDISRSVAGSQVSSQRLGRTKKGTLFTMREDDNEESHLLEKDVEKWCQYAEMDPLPKGPLALFEKLLASTKIPVLEAADGTRKSPSLSNATNDIVVADVNESLLPQEQDLSSPKLPDPSFDKNDEKLFNSSDMNSVQGSDEASEAREREVPHSDLGKELISHSDHEDG